MLALLSGCVQVEQTLSLDANGGGTLAIQYGMEKTVVADLEARARAEAEASGEPSPMPFSFDEEKIREDFKEYEPLGIILEEARSWEEDDHKYIRLQIRFSSLAALTKTEFFSDRNLKLKRVAADAFEFRQVSTPTEPMPAESRDMMRELMAGFRAKLTVEVPGRALDSNADEKEDRRVSWIFDLAQDSNALARAQQMDFWVRFSADGLALPEYPAP